MQPKLHDYCIEKTISLLYNDSKLDVINTLFDCKISSLDFEERIKLMQKGSYMIDRLAIKKLKVHWFGGHYLYPHSHAGYVRGFSDAGTKCVQLYNIAVSSWKKGKFKKSFIALGGATHLVQDLCIPFHTTNLALKKHIKFERWMSAHYLDVPVALENGIYKFSPLQGHYNDKSPFGWVDYNAHNSSKYLPELLYAKNKSEYFKSLSIIIPESIKTSAGFLKLFVKKISEPNNIQE
jgi:hypothetical protein